MDKKIEVKTTTEIFIPEVPKLLKTGEGTKPLSSFDESTLKRVAKTWAEDLLAEAQRQRATK